MSNYFRMRSIPFTSTLTLITSMCFSVLLAGCNGDDGKNKEPKTAVIRPVKTLTVSSTVDQFKRSYSAVVLPSQQVDLSFRVSGKLAKLPIKNGKKVKKGDVIAVLDKRDFKADITQMKSQINQANAQMRAMRAGARPEDIAALNSAVRAAQAKYNSAKSKFGRTQGLVNKGVLPRNELDKDRSALEVAQAGLNAKRQELIKGKAGGRKEDVSAQRAVVQGLNSQLKSLQATLGDATLRAPFDGVIAVRKVENFSNIQAKESVATLQGLSSELDLTFDVPSSDVVKLAKLAEIKKLDLVVKLDSFPKKEFKAEHRAFSTEPDAATQTYQGRVSIKPEKGEPILSGMTGKVIISGGESKSSILILPVTAIASEAGGEPFIWLVNTTDNSTSKRSVTLGDASGANITVLKGLKVGDVVVTAGISALQEGMIVKPITVIGE